MSEKQNIENQGAARPGADWQRAISLSDVLPERQVHEPSSHRPSMHSPSIPPSTSAKLDAVRHDDFPPSCQLPQCRQPDPAPATPTNPLIHLSNNPLPLPALAAILGCTRSTIRHFAERLGFRYTVRRIVSVSRGTSRHLRRSCGGRS